MDMTIVERERQSPRLDCKRCGNTERFLEVMYSEAHVVDGSLMYVRLLEAEVDHYRCLVCDSEVAITYS